MRREGSSSSDNTDKACAGALSLMYGNMARESTGRMRDLFMTQSQQVAWTRAEDQNKAVLVTCSAEFDLNHRANGPNQTDSILLQADSLD